jgi:hypothetical protein
MIPLLKTILFNCQIVLLGIGKFTLGIKKKIFFQVYHFSSWKAGHGVVNKDPTVWEDEAKPSPSYIFKYINIKITELYINDLQIDDETVSDGNCQIGL